VDIQMVPTASHVGNALWLYMIPRIYTSFQYLFKYLFGKIKGKGKTTKFQNKKTILTLSEFS
jgi:hypothetical protein